MRGPYPLKTEIVDTVVKKEEPGNYAIGSEAADGAFEVEHLGRSDSNLRARLKLWSSIVAKRMFFKFSYARSRKAAFEKECDEFHAYRTPGRHVHPAPPNEEDWHCPVCGFPRTE